MIDFGISISWIIPVRILTIISYIIHGCTSKILEDQNRTAVLFSDLELTVLWWKNGLFMFNTTERTLPFRLSASTNILSVRSRTPTTCWQITSTQATSETFIYHPRGWKISLPYTLRPVADSSSHPLPLQDLYQAGNGEVLPYMAGVPKFSLSSLYRIHKRLHVIYDFPSYTPFPRGEDLQVTR